jgi:hypothetical protein
MRRRALAAALAVALFGVAQLAAQAEAQEVDLELVLLADASRSIDDDEIMFQRRGYASAITDPEILSAITQGFHGKVALTFVEWGDATSQEVVVPWTIIDGEASAAAFANALLQTPRRGHGPNAIGSALTAAQALIEGNAIEGFRKVIDFSGDSAYSFGGVPVGLARQAALDSGIVINGLAILCRTCTSGRPGDYDLEAAFGATITGGPGSFVITADGRPSFAEAVRKKMLLEVAGPAGPTGPARRAAMAE